MLEDILRSVRGSYYASPSWMKKIIGRAYLTIPTQVRLGKTYAEFQELLSQSRSWSSQQIADYQFAELKRTLELAYAQIPYYKRTFSEYGVSPNTLRAPEDIREFPLLTKEQVKNHLQELINPNIPKWKHLVTTTGGGTAEPMRFFQLRGVTRSKERAFIHSGWSRIGYQPGDRVVHFGGRSVGSPSKGIYWEYEPIQNMLEMDSSFLTAERIGKYLDQIVSFRPDYLFGFPSSLYLLAKFVRDERLTFPEVKGIMLASENVYSWQRTMLKAVFGCRIFSHYGHSEMVLLAMESKTTNDMLVFPEYGYLEVIDEAQKPVTREGGLGELVGTSFHNPVMPFIRYRTQDFGVVGCGPIDGCNYPVLKNIEGRLQEFIVTRDGRLISIATMAAAHFDVFDEVAATQYYQEVPGEIEFRLVPKPGFTARQRRRIEKAIARKTGSAVKVTLREVETIENSPSGKHTMLVQKIPLKELEGSLEHVLRDLPG